MAGGVEGKVAFVSGAGRGQGRSHAVRLAEEGADIIATPADVRDVAGLRAALDAGVAELGRLDIVCANAGICTMQTWDNVTPEVWQDTLDTNLTGVWNTMVVAAPHLIAGNTIR